MKIQLLDTFNDRIISTHRNIKNAVRAQQKHAKDLSKRSPGAYLNYDFVYAKDGNPVNPEEVMIAEESLCREAR